MRMVALGNASQRVKNRLREHRDFLLPVLAVKVPCLGDEEGFLLTCTCHEEPWVGWVRRKEVIEAPSLTIAGKS